MQLTATSIESASSAERVPSLTEAFRKSQIASARRCLEFVAYIRSEVPELTRRGTWALKQTWDARQSNLEGQDAYHLGRADLCVKVYKRANAVARGKSGLSKRVQENKLEATMLILKSDWGRLAASLGRIR